MEKVYTVKEVREQVKAWRREGLTVGLVPTMGYLHEGHASLIKKAVEQNDKVVVSVFLNPTQFGPTEDLEAYPRDSRQTVSFVNLLEQLWYFTQNHLKCMHQIFVHGWIWMFFLRHYVERADQFISEEYVPL